MSQAHSHHDQTGEGQTPEPKPRSRFFSFKTTRKRAVLFSLLTIPGLVVFAVLALEVVYQIYYNKTMDFAGWTLGGKRYSVHLHARSQEFEIAFDRDEELDFGDHEFIGVLRIAPYLRQDLFPPITNGLVSSAIENLEETPGLIGNVTESRSLRQEHRVKILDLHSEYEADSERKARLYIIYGEHEAIMVISTIRAEADWDDDDPGLIVNRL